MNKIFSQFDAQIAPDGARRRVSWIRRTHHGPNHLEGVRGSLEYEDDGGPPAHEADEVVVEGLAFVLCIVPTECLAIECAEFGGDDTEALAFEARDDLSDQTALDRIGFTNDERAIHDGRG